MSAECGAALNGRSLAGLALGLELSLFMLSGVLVFGGIGSGHSVRLDYDVADTFNWDFSDYLIFRDLAA